MSNNGCGDGAAGCVVLIAAALVTTIVRLLPWFLVLGAVYLILRAVL